MKIQTKNCLASWSLFWWVLAPSWLDFGRLLATKLELCWHQMASKRDLKAFQKNDCSLESLRNEFSLIFGGFWGASWGGQGGPTSDFFGDLLALGAKMRPRPLQGPHKTPQEPPRAQFWWIFGWFLVHFCSIVGWFLFDFWSIFLPTSGPVSYTHLTLPTTPYV